MMAGTGDTYLDAIARAASFADRNWTPETRELKPSWIVELRYCMLASAGHMAEARALAERWLDNLGLEYRVARQAGGLR